MKIERFYTSSNLVIYIENNEIVFWSNDNVVTVYNQTRNELVIKMTYKDKKIKSYFDRFVKEIVFGEVKGEEFLKLLEMLDNECLTFVYNKTIIILEKQEVQKNAKKTSSKKSRKENIKKENV